MKNNRKMNQLNTFLETIEQKTERFKKSAIIGYWRNGMTWQEIATIMDISTFDAERIVFNYTKGIN